MIPKDASHSTTREFKQAWGSQDKEVKAKLIKSIQDTAAPLSVNASMSSNDVSISTTMVPWKPSAPHSANFMKLLQGPITSDVIQTFLANTAISSV